MTEEDLDTELAEIVVDSHEQAMDYLAMYIARYGRNRKHMYSSVHMYKNCMMMIALITDGHGG